MQPGQTLTPNSTPETPGWQYNPGAAPQPSTQPPASQTPQPAPQAPVPAPQPQSNGISWTASEFIAHSKPNGWYAMLALGTIVTAGIVYLMTQDKVSTGVILFVAVIFGISAARKPREQRYGIDEDGVTIGDKKYPFNTFKSFSIVQEEGIESIWLMPLKRFRPPISIYFDPNDGDQIVNILSQFLPIEDHQLDAVDRLMHRLRF